jgi:hypothetical protein
MKRKRFTEEQIIAALKEAEAGVAVKDLIRKHSKALKRRCHPLRGHYASNGGATHFGDTMPGSNGGATHFGDTMPGGLSPRDLHAVKPDGAFPAGSITIPSVFDEFRCLAHS